MDINDLLQERGELVHEMRVLNDACIEKKKDLEGEELTKYNKMEERLEAISNQVARAQRLNEIERSKPASEVQNHGDQKPESGGIQLVTYDIPLKNAEKFQTLASDEYGKNFWNVARTGRQLSRPEILNALQVGTNSEGGFIVPVEYDRMLVEKLIEHNEFRQWCDVIQTSSQLKIPTETDQGTATWTAEEAAYTESDSVFGQATLDAHKLGRIIKVSEELIRDAMFDLGTYLANAFGKSFGIAEENAFVNGDGSGKPTGFLVDAENGVTAASATAITADEVIDLYYSLKRPYRRNARFTMADGTVKLVRKLKDGDGQYLWQPGLQADEPDRLMGRPLVTSTGMPAATTGLKSVAFGDLSYYRIADRIGREMQRLDELYAANGQIGFKMSQRVDGKLLVAEAIKTLTQA